MSAFPELDGTGIAYRVTLWSDLTGGIPVLVGVPARPDLDEGGIEEEVKKFARGLATSLEATITNVIRYEAASSELSLLPE